MPALEIPDRAYAHPRPVSELLLRQTVTCAEVGQQPAKLCASTNLNARHAVNASGLGACERPDPEDLRGQIGWLRAAREGSRRVPPRGAVLYLRLKDLYPERLPRRAPSPAPAHPAGLTPGAGQAPTQGRSLLPVAA